MRRTFSAVAMSLLAAASMAQASDATDSYTMKATGKLPDGQVFNEVIRRDSTAGECLSNAAIFASHPQMTGQNAHYEGTCTQDNFPAGGVAKSFSFVCDANKAPAAAGRLVTAGMKLFWNDMPVDVAPTDVLAVCARVSPKLAPAPHLASRLGLPVLAH